MPVQKLKRWVVVVFAFVAGLACAPRVARAGEVQLDLGFGGEGSSWRNDGAGFGSLQPGYRFKDIVAPYFLARIGGAAVDSRMLTFLSIGVQGWARIGKDVFSTRAQIFEHKERIFERSAGNNDSMPPGPDDPPIEERDKLAEWLVCGAP